MKKILLLSLASLIGVSLNAQNFEGKRDLKKLQPEKLSFTKEKSFRRYCFYCLLKYPTVI